MKYKNMPYIAMLTALVGCSNDVHNHPNLTTGKQLFEYHCASCHGVSGKGIFLKGVPANNDTELTTALIMHKITQDTQGGMPEFTNMPTKEAEKIAYYLKSIKRQ
jgi:mono/diheme cytochrome c family protein